MNTNQQIPDENLEEIEVELIAPEIHGKISVSLASLTPQRATLTLSNFSSDAFTQGSF